MNMKPFRHIVMLAVCVAVLGAHAASQVVDGIEWQYRECEGGVEIGTGNWYEPAISQTITGSISLPSVLGGKPLVAIGSYAFCDCSGLTSVTIPSSVTSIGDGAFEWCSVLTSMTIPTNVVSIGDYAFHSCTSLTSLTIPPSVTNIGDFACFQCSGLVSATISKGLTTIGQGVFYECSGLESVTIPSSITEIGESAFWGCTRLRSMIIPEGVKSIGGTAFEVCHGLVSVTIPSSVTNIGHGAFSCCSGLMSINVDEKNANYKSANGMLLSKDGMVLLQGVNGSVTIPDGVTNILEGAFYNCSGLTSVTIPSSVVCIESQAFSGCSGLTAVMIPSSVTRIEGLAFFRCSGLMAIEVDGKNPNYKSVNGLLLSNDGTMLKQGINGSVIIPSCVTAIESYAFSECTGLTSVAIPSSVRIIGYGAFWGCPGLTSVTIPSSVIRIEGLAFSECSGLKSIEVDEENPSYKSINGLLMTKDGKMLLQCLNIDGAVSIPDGVISIANFAFSYCKGVTSVEIPSSVKNIGYGAFSDCNGLTTVTIPSGVTSIEGSAFWFCSGMTSVTIPSSVTNIGQFAFAGCEAMRSVFVDDGDVNRVMGLYPWQGWIDIKVKGAPSGDDSKVTTLVITNIVIHYIVNSVQPGRVIPATMDTGFVNIITEVKSGGAVAVPETWAANYPGFAAKFGGDFTKALTKETGKRDGAGNPMLVWQDYVAGTDPTNPDDRFTASVTMDGETGKPIISWTPELTEVESAQRVYTTYGKAKLSDADWSVVEKGRESDFNFFKVTVEMK